jgi:exopolysaccharide biosynthesis polyprenyl glycosylphosphotransferase
MRSEMYHLKKGVLFLGDLLVFQIALLPTLFLRYGAINGADWERHAVPFGLISLFWCINFYIAGVYQIEGSAKPLEMLRIYLEAMVANLGLSIAFFYLVPGFGIAPRTNLFLHFLISLVFGYAWHILFNRFAKQSETIPVLYIGPEQELSAIEALLKENPFGYKLVAAYCEPTSRIKEFSHQVEGVTLFRSVSELMQAVSLTPFEAVILQEKRALDQSLKEVLYHLVFQTATFFDRSEIEETIAQRVPVRHVSDTWLLQHINEAEKNWYERIKRGTDLLLSIPFGILTVLFFPFIAVGTKITSPGPLLYSQTRVGKAGKTFELWKFRTMQVDAEKNGPQFTAQTKTDPRITWFGKILRQLRIDELPQIWNVLKGDLSFIGPRPERPAFVTPLLALEPFYSLRHLTRPGLTGWAQVTFLKPNASLEDNLTKLQYDLYYIKHRSFFLDLTILLKTIGIVIRRKGV